MAEYPHITRVPGVCGGEPIIDGLRVSVRHVATQYRLGDDLRDIAEALNITVPQACHALSYYFDHQAAIDLLIDLEEQAHQKMLTP